MPIGIYKRKPHKEETKKKLSLAKMGAKNPNYGKHLSEETRKKLSANSARYFLGKKMSREQKEKISISRRGKCLGENNPAWRGGTAPLGKIIRKSIEYKDWRKSIFQRDNYTCQGCGACGVEFHPDHIKPFSFIIISNNIKSMDEARKCNELWGIDNGKTLCVSCHSKTDTYKSKALNYK